MENYNFTNPSPIYNGWEGIAEGLVGFFKAIVKESVKEVIQDKSYENVVFDQKLTTRQLCERWNISDTTLLAWEKRGVISPIQTGGRKKLYSLKDIREVEANGFIKRRA